MRKHLAVIAIICVALFYLTACEKKTAEEDIVKHKSGW